MSYVFFIHTRQDLTVLHCFQIKDGKKTEKIDHKRRFTAIDMRTL
jgi:phage-related protein